MAFALAFSILARADVIPGPVLLRVAIPRAAALFCVETVTGADSQISGQRKKNKQIEQQGSRAQHGQFAVRDTVKAGDLRVRPSDRLEP